MVGGINYFVAPKFRQKYASNPEQLRRVSGALACLCRAFVVVPGVEQLCLLRCSRGACIRLFEERRRRNLKGAELIETSLSLLSAPN